MAAGAAPAPRASPPRPDPGGGSSPPSLSPRPTLPSLTGVAQLARGGGRSAASLRPLPAAAVLQREPPVCRYGGSLNKFLADDKGTTIIAAFNLPLPPGSTKVNPQFLSEHAARAVGAALEAKLALDGGGTRRQGHARDAPPPWAHPSGGAALEAAPRARAVPRRR